MPTIQESWTLLTQSGLVLPGQIDELQGRFAQMRGAGQGNAPLLIEWLIADGVVTRFQADALLAGRSGPFLFGDFQIDQRIMSGRLQGSFRAIHRPTQHPVLLVFFSDSELQDPSVWPAIGKTAQMSFAVDLTYVIGAHELIDLDRYRFAVIDDVYGTALADVLSGGTTMNVSQACTIARNVAMALASMHAAGLSHGDVCPANIWLAEDGQARLLSFPLSNGMLAGRPPLEPDSADYAAPEINPNLPAATPAGDIYALGCVLYQVLAGRPPFASPYGVAQGVAEKMQRHANEPIVPLHQVGSIPEPINQIVSYMMAKNVDVRYSSAQTIVEALGPYADPIPAARTMPTVATRATYLSIAAGRRVANAAAIAATSPLPAVGQPTAEHQSADPLNAAAGAAATTPATQLGTAAAVGATAGASAAAGAAAVGPNLDELFEAGNSGTAGSGSLASNGDRSAGDSPGRKLTRSKKNMLFAVGIAAAFALVATGALMSLTGPDEKDGDAIAATDGPDTDGSSDGETSGKEDTPAKDPTGQNGGTSTADLRQPYENLIADDGKLLWGSPTHGELPDIRYIASNPQLIFMIRTSAILKEPSGKQFIDAMGPVGPDFTNWVVAETGFQPSEIDRLHVAMYESASGRPSILSVVRFDAGKSIDQLVERWNSPAVDTYNGTKYYRQGQRAYYVPAGRTDAFAVGSIEQIHQVVDFLDEPAWLAAPVEELRKAADADRHINVLFSPNFLRSARTTLYPGRLAPLHEAISWLLGPDEEIQAGLLSINVADNFFSELRLYGVREKRPDVLARQFHERLGEIPRQMSGHLFGISISPYSRGMLSALPDMLRSLHRYTRHDQDRVRGRQAVLRCYLPVGAVSHMAMATDLVLLETAGTSGGSSTGTPVVPKTVWQKLKQPTSLVFERDNLIQGLASLSTDIGVKVEIQGKDLEMEGITKNQSFGINMRDKPAEDILVQIMMSANPDKTVSSSNDPKLELIYVVKEKLNGGEDVIWVTTRTAATGRGDTVPKVFAVAQ